MSAVGMVRKVRDWAGDPSTSKASAEKGRAIILRTEHLAKMLSAKVSEDLEVGRWIFAHLFKSDEFMMVYRQL